MPCSSAGGPGRTSTGGPVRPVGRRDDEARARCRPAPAPWRPSGTSACLRIAGGRRLRIGAPAASGHQPLDDLADPLLQRRGRRPTGGPGTRPTTSAVRSSAVGPSPPEVITSATPVPGEEAQRAAQVLGAVADDDDVPDVDAQPAQLLGQPRPVAVGHPAGQHLGPGDDDAGAYGAGAIMPAPWWRSTGARRQDGSATPRLGCLPGRGSGRRYRDRAATGRPAPVDRRARRTREFSRPTRRPRERTRGGAAHDAGDPGGPAGEAAPPPVVGAASTAPGGCATVAAPPGRAAAGPGPPTGQPPPRPRPRRRSSARADRSGGLRPGPAGCRDAASPPPPPAARPASRRVPRLTPPARTAAPGRTPWRPTRRRDVAPAARAPGPRGLLAAPGWPCSALLLLELGLALDFGWRSCGRPSRCGRRSPPWRRCLGAAWPSRPAVRAGPRSGSGRRLADRRWRAGRRWPCSGCSSCCRDADSDRGFVLTAALGGTRCRRVDWVRPGAR